MKQKEKDLLIKINESINKEYGLDPRTPITDTQRSLREMVKNSIEQYFEDLGGHETINLYELVLLICTGLDFCTWSFLIVPLWNLKVSEFI